MKSIINFKSYHSFKLSLKYHSQVPFKEPIKHFSTIVNNKPLFEQKLK